MLSLIFLKSNYKKESRLTSVTILLGTLRVKTLLRASSSHCKCLGKKLLVSTTKCFMERNYKNVNKSTLVVSKSKGLSEILRYIRISTYQIYRIEEKINPTTTFHKLICNLTPEVQDILKILWKREEIAP